MTTVDTTELRNEVAARIPQAGRTIRQVIEEQRPQIARAVPTGIDADRFTRLVLTELSRTPKLAECTPASLLGSMFYAAQLGVEPGPLGLCYLVPFGNKVTFILGYRGAIALARRSGEILDIKVREVYAKDHFELEYGIEDKLVHRPALYGDRGDVVLFYGIARFKDGGYYILTLTPDEVDARRKRSKASNNGPWVTDYLAMAKKSVVRAMLPYLPLTTESATAIEQDERLLVEFDPDKADPIEITETPYEDVPEVGVPSLTAGAVEQGPPADHPPVSPTGGSAPTEAEDGGPLPEILDSYDGETPGVLRKRLVERSLDDAGTKPELIERLRADDARPM